MKNVVRSRLIRLEHYIVQNVCYKSMVTQKEIFCEMAYVQKRGWREVRIFDCNPTEEGVRNENAMQTWCLKLCACV